MKHIYFLTILFFSIASSVVSQEKTYLSNAINVAGKQRMLGQRMAKNKVYITANRRAKLAEQELNKTVAGFQKGLSILKKFAPTPAVKHKVDIQEYFFKTYRKAILSNSRNSLNEVVQTNTLFLAVCDDVVTELINYSKTLPSQDKNQEYVITKIAEATGASGKLRYLTQRLTLYYAMHKLDVKNVTPAEVNEIVQTMDKNLNYLTVLEFNTIDIDDALGKVHYYWNQLKDNLYKNGTVDLNTQNLNADSMYDLCNTILDEANKATKMYADLNKS